VKLITCEIFTIIGNEDLYTMFEEVGKKKKPVWLVLISRNNKSRISYRVERVV